MVDRDRVVAREAVEPPGEERLEREMAAVLLAHDHDDRGAVHSRGRQRGDRVAQAGGRVQERERRRAGADRQAGGHPHDRALVEAKDEAQVAGQTGEERDLGRAGVREDRGEAALAQDAERRVAHRARGRVAGVPTGRRRPRRPRDLAAHGTAQ